MELLKQFLQLLGDWLGLLAPFGIVTGAFWKFWLKKRFEDGKDLYDKIKMISEEFRPNGGSTLRDAINRIEQKVTIQEQKTLAIIKSLPLGTWISDHDGKWIDVNRSLCKIVGRTEGELKGDNWSNWIHPTQRDSVIDEWERCVHGDMNFDMEYKFVLSNGNSQKIHAVAYQLKDASGKVIGFLGTISTVGTPERFF